MQGRRFGGWEWGTATYRMEDHSGADQVDAVRHNKAGREQVEVVRDAIGLDRVAGIVSSLKPTVSQHFPDDNAADDASAMRHHDIA